MNHISLFSGIGGFDLAAQWMGWNNVAHCEINPFGRKVLHHYWPNAISYEDITKTDFSVHRGTIDILTGGFPCQPYSHAGKRLGNEDDRHLWPHMLRAIREIKPRYIVGENVLGFVNWNGGLVFNEVQADLEAEGYSVQAFVLPACSINAPHKRDRVWIVANSSGDVYKGGLDAGTNQSKEAGGERENQQPDRWDEDGQRVWVKSSANGTNAADTDSQFRCEGRMHKSRSEETERHAGSCSTWYDRGDWQDFPTQSPVCSRNDGLSSKLDGITFSKWRNESVKAYGNAVVPALVYQIFKAIQEYENLPS